MGKLWGIAASATLATRHRDPEASVTRHQLLRADPDRSGPGAGGRGGGDRQADQPANAGLIDPREAGLSGPASRNHEESRNMNLKSYKMTFSNFEDAACQVYFAESAMEAVE